MKELTCIVAGGGHAGIHAVKSLLKASQENAGMRRMRIILIDKQPHHLRKVLLFKPAAGGDMITIPWDRLLPSGVCFVQGAATKVDSAQKRLHYTDAEGNEQSMEFDRLIVTIGSIVRQPEAEQGGIALTGLEAAASIRERWRSNLQKAVRETNAKERERLLTIAVAGAGISGIETSAELACAVREEAKIVGLDPEAVKIYLLNAQSRLFHEGPGKVGDKLERILHDYGVTVLHQAKALYEWDGELTLNGGNILSVGLCVWTLGLQPNPSLRSLGLPLTEEGQIIVDSSYRVQGAANIYSIGDCAHIIDPASSLADRMTCKEATAQAVRLGKIVAADAEGRTAPNHKGHFDFFCFGLGPGKALVWTRQWGLDLIITGRLGWKIRKLTWDLASLVKE